MITPFHYLLIVTLTNIPLSLPSEVTHPRSLVISSQVSQRGGNGEAVEALLDNPVTITFSFEAVCSHNCLTNAELKLECVLHSSYNLH